MTTQENFPGLPPFPDNIPTAPLTRLSLSKLLAYDELEIDRLMRACCDIGFFYLDLQGTEIGDTLLATADKLFQTGTELFQLPLAEKQKYDFSAQNSYHGYKAQGAMIADKEGNLDRNEFYNVSKDTILNLTPAPHPSPAILTNSKTHTNLQTFTKTSHSITTLLLTHLNKTLHLPDSTLPNLHNLHTQSSDQIRFIRSPPQPPRDPHTASMGEHTDFGSVTILFNRVGGLQVLPAGEDAEWTYVRPLPGHAIVNLGDALVKFTNGLLRSNIHRVVAPPGEQGTCTRYSLVYFARPGDEVVLRRLESDCIPVVEGEDDEGVSSKEWVLRRALGRRGKLGTVDYEKSAGTEMVSRRIRV